MRPYESPRRGSLGARDLRSGTLLLLLPPPTYTSPRAHSRTHLGPRPQPHAGELDPRALSRGKSRSPV